MLTGVRDRGQAIPMRPAILFCGYDTMWMVCHKPLACFIVSRLKWFEHSYIKGLKDMHGVCWYQSMCTSLLPANSTASIDTCDACPSRMRSTGLAGGIDCTKNQSHLRKSSEFTHPET